ncbi:hypothetical protein POTOM_023102 [Populus tomentosa]|uniref:Uncharacterized protein n=1 Tax=Populus tomentosa TaxID=118781 RepID=A0A8X7ZMD7_POPTO|nr:hypothetical protein POTOM_023102 [Populus tomentosa]
MGCFHRRVAVCALLIVILFTSSISVLTEARISKFEAIQGAKLLKFESPWTSFTPKESKKPSPSATESEADWHFSKFPIGKSFNTSTWVGVSKASWVTIFLQNIYFDDVGLTIMIQKWFAAIMCP